MMPTQEESNYWKKRAIAAEAEVAEMTSAIIRIAKDINGQAQRLRVAIGGTASAPLSSTAKETENMAATIPPTGNPIIDALTAADSNLDTAAGLCVTYIQGVPALITAAVNKALAGGATADQLTAVTQVATDIQAQAAAMQAALATPPPVTP
jgi:hypothetical protein